jgi:CubicO group peptidase (beta-lactamase class C family)
MSAVSSVSVLPLVSFADQQSKLLISQGGSPGAGFGLVNRLGIIHAAGYGLADRERNIPYTTSTVQLLASVSKPISGTLVCYLAQQGTNSICNAVGWPAATSYIQQNLTVKDVLAHRSGIPEYYGVYPESIGYSRKDIISTLGTAPNAVFRDTFNYTDLPFTQATEQVCASVGRTFDQATAELFQRLNMPNTSTDYQPSKYIGYIKNSAGKWLPFPNYDNSQQVAAGGVYSTLLDMSNFVQFHLAEPYQPRPTILPAFYDPIYSINTSFCGGRMSHGSGSDVSYYGLGLQSTYLLLNGHRYLVYSHSGALYNVHTAIYWCPELDLGIVTFTNSLVNGYPEALSISLLGLAAGDSTETARGVYNVINQTVTTDFANLTCPIVALAGPSVKQANYNSSIDGTYTNPSNGQVTLSNGRVQVGKLAPVVFTLSSTVKNGYDFALANRQGIPFGGSFIVNGSTLRLTYGCMTTIYTRANAIDTN